MGSEIVPTPADVLARATKMLKRVLALQVVWFLCFVVGGVLVIVTAWENGHVPTRCNGKSGAVSALAAGCGHHSYLPAVVLILLGIGGLLVTGYVATRLAVKYLGQGATAFLRSGRLFMGSTGPRPGTDAPGFFGEATVIVSRPPSLLPPEPEPPPPRDIAPGSRDQGS